MLAKRTYLQTHPWITFDLRTKTFPPRTWMLLGEAASKAQHIAGVPLNPQTAQQFHRVTLAKGARATTAIEGNTLTEDQVEAQIEGRLKLPPSQQYLQQEVQNIVDACNWMLEDRSQNGHRKITPEFCCDLNARVLKGLALEDGVAGQIRRHSVVVGNVYRGAPAEDCHYLLERLCDTLEETRAQTVADAHSTAILKALFAHMYIALIHPFCDGNGRTARLLEYYILMEHGFASPTGHLLSNHYNLTRSHYYRELDRISKTGGETDSFVTYALQGFVDGLKEQIETIRTVQLSVAWENYVHKQFHGKSAPADSRRRELVLQLGSEGKQVKIVDIPGLSPKLARDYAGKTEKTLSRDLNVLAGMGLIRRFPGRRVGAQSDKIRAFLPWRAQ
ncbi:Fic family protein [Rhodopseudomonas palustris]|uniref:Fic family protein n=1 Tax=Rhodopseudomonas palustris TaxID=1076 RepID=UPI002ACE320E|nr:Fic family protein [Rhodopseudomonas palustris]WQH00185.1 Fic family protein [Rhodopseudomonas palustris]